MRYVTDCSRRLAFGSAALVLAVGHVSQAAKPDLDMLLELLHRAPGMEADFVEEKTIALLARPVVSRGRIFFVAPDRFARHTQEPEVSTLVVHGARLEFQDRHARQTVDLGSQATAQLFVDSFLTVLRGEKEQLERRFEVSFTPPREKAGPWRLRLLPRDPKIRRVLAEVSLEGTGAVLAVMRVTETNGDVAVTRFQNVDLNREFSEGEVRQLFQLNPGETD